MLRRSQTLNQCMVCSLAIAILYPLVATIKSEYSPTIHAMAGRTCGRICFSRSCSNKMVTDLFHRIGSHRQDSQGYIRHLLFQNQGQIIAQRSHMREFQKYIQIPAKVRQQRILVTRAKVNNFNDQITLIVSSRQLYMLQELTDQFWQVLPTPLIARMSCGAGLPSRM